jgi:hypothetical protein
MIKRDTLPNSLNRHHILGTGLALRKFIHGYRRQ